MSVIGSAGEVRLEAQQRNRDLSDMPTGYIYNLLARLPGAHAGAASGLCRSQGSGSGELGGASLFTPAELAWLEYRCFSASGVPREDYAPIDNAADACADKGVPYADAVAACAGVSGTHATGCIYDYCVSGLEDVVDDANQAAQQEALAEQEIQYKV